MEQNRKIQCLRTVWRRCALCTIAGGLLCCMAYGMIVFAIEPPPIAIVSDQDRYGEREEPVIDAGAGGVISNEPIGEEASWQVTGGNTGIGTLEQALSAVKIKGGTVKLLANVTREESIVFSDYIKEDDIRLTLDLNGKTLTAGGDYSLRVDIGQLIINDQSSAKAGKINGTVFVNSENQRELPQVTVNGGTFEGKTAGLIISRGIGILHAGTFIAGQTDQGNGVILKGFHGE